MNALNKELVDLILVTCNIKDVAPETIDPDAPLIGSDAPLGIDSIDALEIAVAVQREYGVRMDSDHTSREVLQSLRTLAEYVAGNRPSDSGPRL